MMFRGSFVSDLGEGFVLTSLYVYTCISSMPSW